MKKFTILQLFSLIDGRLSTKMDDIYDMLNHITGDSLMTHHLPVANQFIKQITPIPQWLTEASLHIANAKQAVGNNFEDLMKYLKENNVDIEVPALTEEEKAGFGDYMIKNSLLLKNI